MSEALLEEFRKKIAEEFTAKGAEPPEPESVEEQKLFERWLKGREILNQKRNEL